MTMISAHQKNRYDYDKYLMNKVYNKTDCTQNYVYKLLNPGLREL